MVGLPDEALVHLQQARAFANYLAGGKNHDTVCADHVMTSEEAADLVRAELDEVLILAGVKA